MPRSVLITTATLVVLAGLGGYWLGQRQVTLDSSAIIMAVAERHVAQHGGRVTDCIGLPGADGAVFHVRCLERLYAVDRLGRVREIAETGI
ncbi:hypothetical protein [Tateyamaria sp. SN6-1]|uniref:hypothetical protein n=1 Tax=Tateyamaria sp. SN6-1 TaxID=3092148 RepID=UPI0039F59D14